MIHQDSIAATASVGMVTETSHHTHDGARVSPKLRPRIKTDKCNGSMNGPLYMQTPKTVLVRRRKRKDDGAWKQISRWFVENQVGFSFNLISLLFLAHASIPKAREHTIKFFTLSYFNPSSGLFGIGHDDVYLLSFCIVLFTGLRAACMEYMLAPYAKRRGLVKRKEVTRFSEQAWMVIYYTIFWVFGLYVYRQSPHWVSMRELWTDWPTRELAGPMKAYMLLQWAFWLQQVIVINIEDRRKDHWQMLTHHVITIGLIHASYVYHFTRVGHLIMITMDVVDILLPLAKCLKYLGHTILCDYVFGAFMVTWVLTRHIVYNLVVYSVYKDTADLIPDGCYTGSNIAPPTNGIKQYLSPFQDPYGTVCWDYTVKWCFLAALISLQVLTIGWFILIVNVAIKVVTGSGAEDVRSDDEGDGEDDEFEYEEAEPMEEEVGVESIDLHAWEKRAGVKRQSVSSGVTLPGHSDRKELLGRIGCEKQVD